MHRFFKFCSWNEILHVSDSSSVHHQESFTVRNGICDTVFVTACEQNQDALGKNKSSTFYVFRIENP
jgi:hypothetical protein